MKLYYHPVSTTCRSIMLFAAESGIDIEYKLVDLMKGEHHGEAYAKINPSRQVPVLDDGGFVLTESSAILKYLADKTGSKAYPKDLKQRARVNEAMDWINSNLYRDYGYGLIYPQIFPHHKRPDDKAQAGTVKWGQDKTRNWMRILNDHLIGPKKKFLCGDEITIADYFSAAILTSGEVIGCDFTKYPNIARWLKAMKGLKTWKKTNEGFDGMVGAFKGNKYETV